MKFSARWLAISLDTCSKSRLRLEIVSVQFAVTIVSFNLPRLIHQECVDVPRKHLRHFLLIVVEGGYAEA